MTLAAFAFCALAALPAAAADSAKVVKIAVLDARASGTADPKLVGGLDPLVAAEVSGGTTAQVSSGADLRAMIGFEKQKELMGCGDSSCLAEIGGALGVDYLMSIDVSLVGGTWLVSASIVEIAKARPIGRVVKRADAETKLVDTAIAAVAEAIAFLPPELRRAHAAPVAIGVGASPAPVVPAPAVAAVAPAPAEGPSTLVPWLFFVGGLGAAGTGGYLLADAWMVKGDFDQGETTGAPTVSRAQADDAAFGAKLGVGLLSAGVVLIGVGTWLYPSDEEEGASALVLTPTPSGLAATFSLP